jgi:hypothetical protein
MFVYKNGVLRNLGASDIRVYNLTIIKVIEF